MQIATIFEYGVTKSDGMKVHVQFSNEDIEPFIYTKVKRVAITRDDDMYYIMIQYVEGVRMVVQGVPTVKNIFLYAECT